MAENQPSSPPTIQPPPPQTPPGSAAPPPSNPGNDARMWNMLCHLSALAGYIGIPFGNIIGPLIVWQVKKNQIPSVDLHGKASLNFQITVTLALAVLFAAFFVLHFICIGFIFLPLMGLVALAALVFTIIAGIKANNGENYQYPWSLELVK